MQALKLNSIVAKTLRGGEKFGDVIPQLFAARSRNPKSEIRNPKEARSPKLETATACFTTCFVEPTPPREVRISDFGFLSDFGFRVSDLRFHQTPAFAVAPHGDNQILRAFRPWLFTAEFVTRPDKEEEAI